MHLWLLTANPHSRAVAQWLGNPYRIHQRLLRAFPDGVFAPDAPDPGGRLLYRREERRSVPRLLVQTPLPPDWEKAFADLSILAAPPAVKMLEPRWQTGQRLRFLLYCNPTARRCDLPRREDQEAPPRLGITQEDKQVAWLERQGAKHGFQPLNFRVLPRGLQVSWQGQPYRSRRLSHLAVEYEGFLQVTEPDLLWQAVTRGLGTAKAFGFGLLSLAPA